jgi:hypothetical protein
MGASPVLDGRRDCCCFAVFANVANSAYAAAHLLFMRTQDYVNLSPLGSEC